MKQKIELVCKYLIYACFFVPLLVLPSSFIFPFIVPKILMFRSLVTALLGAYIVLLLINFNEYKPKFTALNLALGAFLISFTLSTFFGVDAYHSFWDNHERMLGLFTIFHYAAFYVVCGSVFKNWSEWRTALKIFLIAGAVVMFIGLLQVGNPNLLLNQGSDRVASTLGNSIYVGGYGLFLTFVAILLIFKEKNLFWKWLEYGLGALAFLGIFFSGTRGSILGLIAGAGVIMIGFALALRDQPKAKKILWVMICAGLLLLGILYAYRKTNFVQSIPAVGRTFGTSLQDVLNTARWQAWGIAFQSWKEHPLLGWGPNNFFYAFNKYYQPTMLERGYGETWFDNAHNIIMNTLAVQGLVGLLTYLSIFVIGISSLVMCYRRRGVDVYLTVIGSSFLVAHLVQNVTVFENPTSYLYFMFWLAMVNQSTNVSEPVQAKENNPKNLPVKEKSVDRSVSVGFISAIGLVALVCIFVFNIQPARANMKTLDALRLLNQDPILGPQAMKDALEFGSPHIDDIRADLARTAAQLLSSYYQQLGKDRSSQIFDLAYDNLQKNLLLHPRDIRNQITLSQLGQLGYLIKNNPQYIFDAQRYLLDALKYSPERQQLKYSLAGIDMQMNKSADAIKLLEETIAADPKIAESYWRLGFTYKMAGQDDKAREVLRLSQDPQVLMVNGDSDKSALAQLAQALAPTSTPKTKKK